MKLKNVLIYAFLMLTLIPIIIVSLLLYKSGYDLSKESYVRNLTESISVQTDYIVQTVDNDMILDQRFAHQCGEVLQESAIITQSQKEELYVAFQSYLKISNDKMYACLLLDANDTSIYTIGEVDVLKTVKENLPDLSQLDRQKIIELKLNSETHSLAILTPIMTSGNTYAGCLISIYDQAYLFKIISSYYKLADTSTYICRADGGVINSRPLSDQKQNEAIKEALIALTFTSEGEINMRIEATPITGYYKKIGDTPWYLVGFIDHELVNSFTNQYVFTYFLIIIVVSLVDLLLAFYFSRRVVKPINSLIEVMEGYPGNLVGGQPQIQQEHGYVETQYLHTKFFELMKRILLVQHNFEGVYQLYQSGSMSDTNIDIDTKEQTISSNKEVFQKLMNELEVAPGACIVERFINCFCIKDQRELMEVFENMRDRHLSVPCENEVYTPHLGEKWFHILVVPMYENDSLSHLFIQLRDITGFKKQEMESTEKAIRDSLTGLYNRMGFTQNVTEILQKGDPQALHGIMFVDMDYFKMVNDNLGHAAGDELLCSVGRILLEAAPSDSVVSRFGGDEFAVFLPNSSQESAEQIKETLRQRLNFPFRTEHISFVVTASIGISLWSGVSPKTLEEQLKRADTAMYQEKKRVKQTNDKE